jgi:hypothetical protein
MESGTVYPYRMLKLTWPSLRSGPRSLTPVVIQTIHMEALDAPERTIEEAFSPLVSAAVSSRVFLSHSQRLWKLVYKDIPGQARSIQGELASATIGRAIQELEAWLRRQVRQYSRLRWLWMLRRLPSSTFQGSLGTTVGYDQALAESLTADAPEQPGSLRITRGAVHYELSERVLVELLKLCEGARYLSNLHSLYRWAGKGALIDVSPDRPPVAVPGAELRASVELYDRRVERQAGPFSRLGTAVGLGSNHVLRVMPIDPAEVSLPRSMLGDAIPIDVPADELVTMRMRYDVEIVDVEHLVQLGVASRAELAVLFLLQTGVVYLNRHRTGMQALITRGYLIFGKDVLLDHMRAALAIVDGPLADAMRAVDLVTAEGMFTELATLRGSSWPLILGTAIRAEAHTVCLDLCAATHRLDTTEAPATGGTVANSRAEHFELAVQDLVNSTGWRPSSEIEALRGRTLSIGGRDVTDIDAIGQQGEHLLAISCKAIVQRAASSSGDYAVIRNAACAIQTAVAEWSNRMSVLDIKRTGDNYDFSRFRSIIGVVCTPAIVWVPLGPATANVAPGLMAAVSFNELGSWLRGLDTKASNAV